MLKEYDRDKVESLFEEASALSCYFLITCLEHNEKYFLSHEGFFQEIKNHLDAGFSHKERNNNSLAYREYSEGIRKILEKDMSLASRHSELEQTIIRITNIEMEIADVMKIIK